MTALAMTERDWQGLVVDAARVYGWTVYHTHDSRRSEPGFPDLVLVRGSHLIFAELKTDRGRLTPDQKRWLELLDVVALVNPDVESWVWRPRDQADVFARLARRRSP